MNRAILVCKKFVELAKAFEASEIIAAATAATREAKNKTEFLDKLKTEANLNVSAISGNEEASLTYLGVSSGVHIGNKKAIFIDLGGGSTKITIGNQFRENYVDSLEFGAIRLTTMFIPERINEPVPPHIYDMMKRYVINKMPRTVNTIRSEGIKLAYGSSGTIINLAEISEKMSKKQASKRNLVLKHKDLEKLVSKLCSLTLDERKKIPGINPERADIIIGGGAAIIETLMEQFKLDKITVSERGLIHGMLIDYLSRHEGFAALNEMSVREMSVLMLGRSCNLNEKHANFVTSLALQLFDSSMKIKIHNLGEEERELLKYASFLHDIGDFISFRNHTLHSAYIVSNAELLGFKQSEINIMANVVRFHGKKLPVREYSSTAEFDDSYNTISVLSMLLKRAENLDRSRAGIIKNAEFKLEGGDKVILSLVSAGDCQLEIRGLMRLWRHSGTYSKRKSSLR